MTRYSLPIIALLALSGCKEDLAALPEPAALTEDNLSHYCQMNVLGHGGPKAQVHREGSPAPLFFAQVRDGLAFVKSPERDARILVTYVSDMGSAQSWDAPETANWIPADEAIFVVGADVAGGMGAPELVPFAEVGAAEDFIARFGGRMARLTEVPDDAVFGPVDINVDNSAEVPS